MPEIALSEDEGGDGLGGSGGVGRTRRAPAFGRPGVARQTAAKALHVLVDEGLVTRIPGLGYYVTDRS